MTEFLVQVRQNTGTLDQVNIRGDVNLQQLKQAISKSLGLKQDSFQLYSHGQLLDYNLNQSTLQEIGINPNSVIDVTQKFKSDNMLNLIVEYGMDRANVDAFKQETIRSVKLRIGDIFDCDPSTFDLMFKDQLIEQDKKTIQSYGIKNNELVLVKRKIPMNTLVNGLVSKIKLVESVASSSDNIDQKQSKQLSPLHKKTGFNVQKKSSCSASMRSIHDPQQKQRQRQKNILKHSSIEPYTMHKNQIDEIEQKQNQRVRIQDIKQTMSFGSLEEVRPQQVQTQVELYNEDRTLEYKMRCPFGCKIRDVKNKLASVQRTNFQNIEIMYTIDEDVIQEFSQVQKGNTLSFIFKIGG